MDSRALVPWRDTTLMRIVVYRFKGLPHCRDMPPFRGGPGEYHRDKRGECMGSILATGYLNSVKHRTQTRSEKYNIISLEEKHLPFVMALQEVIVKNLGSPDLLQSFSYDFMKQHMGSKGFVLGVFVGNRLAAFRNVYYPDPWDREWNLGLGIGLTGAR